MRRRSSRAALSVARAGPPCWKCAKGLAAAASFAKQAIAHNDLLLRLPLSMMIHPPDKLAEMVASGETSKILALALTVVHGLHVSSPRTKFFDLLAASPPPDLPMLWDSASLEHLSGTSLLPPDVRAADRGPPPLSASSRRTSGR